jgi:hypothetical protein
MNEAFLHFIWQYRLYNTQITTTSNKLIEVLNPGQHNHDAGPDFTNARVKIENTIWAGNVEIHMKSSDWHRHNHQTDPAYDNVILHVVFENDREILDKNLIPLPTVELKGLIHEGVYKKYFYYLNNQLWIPCEKDITLVNPITISAWMERLFIERMERKTEGIFTLFRQNHKSLSETYYQLLAGNFGFKTNEQPFLMLARYLPVSVLGKHKNSTFQTEALLFGCAGMLEPDFKDDYPNQLKTEFEFLKKKYSLPAMQQHLWKFLRLRPTNFPTIRISQFAALIAKSNNLLSMLMEAESAGEIKSFFDVQASAYWDDHYNFDKPSTKRPKMLGDSATEILIMNSVVQFMFFLSKVKGNESYRNKAIKIMLDLKPEKNHIITKWSQIGVIPRNAFETQALLELKNSYCKQKQCLRCNIGNKLLRQSIDES